MLRFISVCLLTAALIGCGSAPQLEPPTPPVVSRLAFAGEIKGVFGGKSLSGPTALAFDPSGNLYILDTGNNRVVKLDRNLAFVRDNGGYGLGLSGLSRPLAITSDGGVDFFIVDQGNNRIVRSDYNLVFADEIRLNSEPELQSIGKVVAIAFSRFGQMYLVDPDNLRVWVLDQNYSVHQELMPPGGFGRCGAIAVDNEGTVAVADRERGTIFLFDGFGNGKGKITPDGVAVINGFALSPHHLIVADSERSELALFDRSGARLATVGGSGSGPLQFANPGCVVWDGSGKVYVCDSGNNRIVIYDLAAATP